MDTSPAHSVRPRMLRTAMPVACSKHAASSVGSGEPPVYATCMVDELVRWVEGDQSPGPVVARARRRRRRAEPRSAGELGTRPHAAALPVSAGRALPRQRRRRRRCQLLLPASARSMATVRAPRSSTSARNAAPVAVEEVDTSSSKPCSATTRAGPRRRRSPGACGTEAGARRRAQSGRAGGQHGRPPGRPRSCARSSALLKKIYRTG